jgi:phenylalanyl-tRNA synthetase beta chain
MKFSESWLREEWINPSSTRDELCEALTMAGLEVEEAAPMTTELKQDDYVIDLSITPNRGDCLSMRGVAREISALTRTPLLKKPSTLSSKPVSQASLPVTVKSPKDCPIYYGRIIRQVKSETTTPIWLKERLRCSGINSISPIVDVTNYVMLELGQPMHAFDLDTIQQQIIIRKSQKGEQISLLDGSEKQLDDDTLIIADAKNPLAIAGVMGGMDSSVTLLTKNIFLESAFFTPSTVARQRQYYGLSSDSAYRFERGVDPTIQREAIERATQLILEITGGEAGPIIEVTDQDAIPNTRHVTLTHKKLTNVLGIQIDKNEVENIFKALNFTFKTDREEWTIEVPPYRSDISLPEDLIEEIARIYGYNNIPIHTLKAELKVTQAEEEMDLNPLKQLLSDEAYHEIISYSFIDSKLQKLLDPQAIPCDLINPITADMTVMRTNLWPGLIQTMLYNKSRQQHRVRLFEAGVCFKKQGSDLLQELRFGGLVTGSVYPEQWGVKNRDADFYDVKGDIEKILHLLNADLKLSFKPESHPSLHPGQCAGIYQDEKRIGVIGALHPSVLQSLDLVGSNVFVYELDITQLKTKKINRSQEVSKFPEIRRDLALLINEAIPAREIQDTIKVIAGDWLKDVFIFDVYQGKGVSPGLKSIALALILQHPTRTLVDDEITAFMEQVITTLKGQLGAELRR